MKLLFGIMFFIVGVEAEASIPPTKLDCENRPTIQDQVTSHYQHCLSDKFNSIEIYTGHFKLHKCEQSGGKRNLKFMNCLNSNFKTISKLMNIELDKCYNDLIRAPHMKYYLTTLFKSCISRNFHTIDTKIESANI
jgi:hypothetical protein